MKKKPGPSKRSGSTIAATLPVMAAEPEVNASKFSTRGTSQIFIRVSDPTFFSAANSLPIISENTKNRLYAVLL